MLFIFVPTNHGNMNTNATTEADRPVMVVIANTYQNLFSSPSQRKGISPSMVDNTVSMTGTIL